MESNTSPVLQESRQAEASLDTTRPAAARRGARFVRPRAPETLRITDDDIAILRYVEKYRFLRSNHITALLARPHKKVLERLKLLFRNGYLDRPRQQSEYFAIAGSKPIVVALSNKGAALLSEVDGLARSKSDRTWNNRKAGRLFIEHTLSVAEFMVRMETDLRQRNDVELIEPATILAGAPEALQRAKNPWSLTARVQHNGAEHQVGTIPDYVFGLDFTALRKRSYFFFESDRATMPVVRSRLDQTSYYRKLLCYFAGGGSANAHGQRFGIGNFRVLTLTTTPERTANMIAALRDLTGGAGLRQFLFIDRRAASAAPDLLALEWVSASGESARLG